MFLFGFFATRVAWDAVFVDSAGTDGAIEGQSPAENSTNTASHATGVAKKPNRNK